MREEECSDGVTGAGAGAVTIAGRLEREGQFGRSIGSKRSDPMIFEKTFTCDQDPLHAHISAVWHVCRHN
jgi:hypothetical protein